MEFPVIGRSKRRLVIGLRALRPTSARRWVARRSSIHVCVVFLGPQALKVRQADVTRETVQKSVCMLSRVVSGSSAPGLRDFSARPATRLILPVVLQPLYGLLQAKLQLITHAYFEEKNFSQISILKVRAGGHVVASRSPASWIKLLFSTGAVRAHERLAEGLCSGGIPGVSGWVRRPHLQHLHSPSSFYAFFLSVGLSPRDLILHFRHKVGKTG